MSHLLHTVVAFVIVISVLVFVHELGHYLAARWRGVAVEMFSIGFGRRLFGWTDRSGTEWRIAALPLGGFVRMRGQSDLVPDEAPAARPGPGVLEDPWAPSRSFADKSVGSRAIIVAAGPVFNFLFAILLFTGIYATVGRPSDRPMVGGVVAGSPAAAAGIRAGDRILRIDGHDALHVGEVPGLVAPHAGQRIDIVLSRPGTGTGAAGTASDVTLSVVPTAHKDGARTVGQLGIRVQPTMASRRLALPQALVAGTLSTWQLAERICVGLGQIVTGRAATSDLGGPLRIAQVSGQAASAGPESLVVLIAMISVNLGLVNLLPVPVLDGGHLVFYAFEAVLGRPLSRRARELGLQAGLALIACLFLFTTLNDLNSFGLFRWVQSLAG